MTPGADDGESQPAEHEEIVQFGSARSGRRGWLPRLLLGCLLVAAVLLVVGRVGHRPGQRAPSATPTPAPPPMSLTVLGHRLLGIRTGWELLGLSSDQLVSINFAAGQIRRTYLPPPEGTGPVSFIVGPHAAIIRPLDGVPGYLVPYGRQARRLTGELSGGSLLLPGPTPSEEWSVGVSSNTMLLLGPAGGRIGSIELPASQFAALSAMPDGRGDVLVFNSRGTQDDASPGRLQGLGALVLAVGPTESFGVSCTTRPCRNVVIDVATGARRALPGPAVDFVTFPWPSQPGAVAPDGLTAAVVVAHGNGGVALDLINLRSGAATRLSVPINQNTSSQTLAWSPDSRWLFVIDANGQLVAVDAHNGSVHSLGVPLPELTEVAVRPAA